MNEFFAGYVYGITSVIVAQPLDTVKTRMQASMEKNSHSSIQIAKRIYQLDGIKGFYRGGWPLVFGGGIIRSTQFGVNAGASNLISKYKLIDPDLKWLGFLRPHVIAAGFAGGFCRGIVEGPIEFMKVRQQVDQKWTWKEMISGTGK